VDRFLAKRGLTLSAEKTRLTHINEGFDFLGFTIRKFKHKLNSVLRGWAYAHRKVVVKDILSFIDNCVFKQTANWLRKEHRNKTWAWINKNYHKRNNGRFGWGSTYARKEGEIKWVELFRLADLPVRYHTKIRSEANPYDRQYFDYFKQRAEVNRKTAFRDRLFLSSDSYAKLTLWK